MYGIGHTVMYNPAAAVLIGGIIFLAGVLVGMGIKASIVTKAKKRGK
jgi:hypothetical protein